MLYKKFLEPFQGRSVISPPIWIMRQAGRYLPEYKKVRESLGGFLDLCYNPSKAAEVTLQPISRFDFDAAIIFSDILIIPHSLGLSVHFEQGEGPRVERVTNPEDLAKLKTDPDNEKLKKVYEAINLTRSRLPKEKALIGFVGSPWTVATYILEGKGGHDFVYSRQIAYSSPSFLSGLIEVITEQTTYHILGQINAGAEVIQLFDSWAGMLGEVEYEEFVIKPTVKIVSTVKKAYPNVPIIGFPRGSGFLYERYIEVTGVDGVGVDQLIPASKMKAWSEKIVVQGNLDNVILLCGKDAIARKVDEILSELRHIDHYKNFIFNLGHGILPETPIENVEFLVNYIRKNCA